MTNEFPTVVLDEGVSITAFAPLIGWGSELVITVWLIVLFVLNLRKVARLTVSSPSFVADAALAEASAAFVRMLGTLALVIAFLLTWFGVHYTDQILPAASKGWQDLFLISWHQTAYSTVVGTTIFLFALFQTHLLQYFVARKVALRKKTDTTTGGTVRR